MIRSLFAVIFLAFLAVPFAFADGDNYGTFMVSKGDVTVLRANGSSEKAHIGTKVFPKDTVITGKDSRGKIVFVDKNVMNISPETKVIIQSYNADSAHGGENKKVEVNLAYGNVRNTVNQKYDGEKSKFTVKTPSAVAGVRGTDFSTKFSQMTNITKVVTFAGAVDVGKADKFGNLSGAMVHVTPGQFTVASPAMQAPAAPAEMPKNELAKMNNDTNADKKDSGPKGQEGKEPRGPAGNKNEGGARGPAGSEHGSMLTQNDLGPTAAGPNGPDQLGPRFGPPVGPDFIRPNIGQDFIDNAVLQNGRTNLLINITY